MRPEEPLGPLGRGRVGQRPQRVPVPDECLSLALQDVHLRLHEDGAPGERTSQGFLWLEELWGTIASRAADRPEGSYTARLLDGGVDAVARSHNTTGTTQRSATATGPRRCWNGSWCAGCATWWDGARGAAMAYETVSLYGIPVVTGRQVQFGRIDPAAARDRRMSESATTQAVTAGQNGRIMASPPGARARGEAGSAASAGRPCNIPFDPQTI